MTQSATWMRDQYRSLSKDADPMRDAEIKEVVIAQMREEIGLPLAEFIGMLGDFC